MEFWASFIKVTHSNLQTYGSAVQVLLGLLIGKTVLINQINFELIIYNFYFHIVAGMTSLLIAICTFRKQWTFFELLKTVDDTLCKDFKAITPKRIFQHMISVTLLALTVLLVCLVGVTYYVYSVVLKVPPMKICISYFLANFPYFVIIMIFYFSTSTICRRFYFINCILRQLAANDIPKNIFELCCRSSQNSRQIPTISLTEIYSIYGGHLKKVSPNTPPSQAFMKTQEEIDREIKKLATKIENREDNLISKFRRRNIIEIEEFKLSKMNNTEDIIDHLTKLLDMHDTLLDCINLQNKILSFQILMIVAQIFIFKVFCLFSLYRTMYHTTVNTNSLAMSNLFWFIIYVLILYCIMSVSTDCINEGKFTGTCVHKVINKIATHTDPRIVEKLSVMSHQLSMRTPDITCGLFSFDWELMFSIISAITIYLIFLIQFDAADNPSTPDTSLKVVE